MSNLTIMLERLQSRGLEIKTVYDIGAHTGNWSQQTKNTIPNADFFLFEANPAYDQILAKTGFPYLCGQALSNPGRETVEFYNGTNTGDSYYKETTKFYDNQTAIQIPCTTIDKLIDQFSLPKANFIKIDTQGSELDILAGAEGMIGTVDLVLTECPIVCYNKGAPNIHEYLEYFRTRNFIPVGMFEEHVIEDTLIQLDLLFMRADAKEKFLSPNEFIRPLI
jgi:FkbM family methyltransferase